MKYARQPLVCLAILSGVLVACLVSDASCRTNISICFRDLACHDRVFLFWYPCRGWELRRSLLCVVGYWLLVSIAFFHVKAPVHLLYLFYAAGVIPLVDDSIVPKFGHGLTL